MGVEFGTIDTLQAALTFHRDRHTVLAGNVANLDTPNYRPFDLKRTPSAGQVTLDVDSSGHIAQSPRRDVVTAFDDGDTSQGPDGNAVSLERELAKIDANRTRYSTSAELVTRRLALLRYAAGDGT